MIKKEDSALKLYAPQFKMSNSDDDLFYEGMNEYFSRSVGTNIEKLRNFAKYVPRSALSTFLFKNELFNKILDVQGSIIEGGVFLGGGLMTWAQLSAIYEPVNYTRTVIGFDTFTGFPSVHKKDNLEYAKEGDVCVDSYNDIVECIKLYDINRLVNHIPRVKLVKGDARKTIPEYLKNNPHLVVSMLYLDFDLYEPTKIALETLIPRMPKGAMIVFDDLDSKVWQGATTAVCDSIGINNLRIQRSRISPRISYAIIE